MTRKNKRGDLKNIFARNLAGLSSSLVLIKVDGAFSRCPTGPFLFLAFLNMACMSAVFLEVHQMKDDGQGFMLLHNLHQLVYTRTGSFTCTKVITNILIGDLGHAVGSSVGQDQDDWAVF